MHRVCDSFCVLVFIFVRLFPIVVVLLLLKGAKQDDTRTDCAAGGPSEHTMSPLARHTPPQVQARHQFLAELFLKNQKNHDT